MKAFYVNRHGLQVFPPEDITKAAPWWERLAARIFGKRQTVRSEQYVVTWDTWRGRVYIVAMDRIAP